MERAKESEMFDMLARYPRVKEWLHDQMTTTVDILLVNPDIDTIRKAQGQAAFIQKMLDKLESTESVAGRQ